MSYTDPSISAAAQEAVAALDDKTLTAEARAKAIIEGVLKMTFPTPQASSAMADQLRAYAQTVCELRRNCDGRGLVQEALKLQRAAIELSRPLPTSAPHVPTHADDFTDDERRGLAAGGWNGTERTLLGADLMAAHETLVSHDATGVETSGGRRISRQQLRDRAAAAIAPEFRAKFLANLPAIPEARA